MDLELRRLGGDRGLLGLLRIPSESDSNDDFAARVELGAALIACRIAEDASIRPSSSGRSCCCCCSSRGGSNLRLFSASSGDRSTRGDGDETSSCLLCRDGGGSATTTAAAAASSNNDGGVVTARSWETTTLTAIVDALLLLLLLNAAEAPVGGRRSCTMISARTMLLRVLPALGHGIHDSGVASRLFSMLSDGMRRSDTQCCTSVVRALAIGMHGNVELSRQSACVHRISLLFALAFPALRQRWSLRVHSDKKPTSTATTSSAGRSSSSSSYSSRENEARIARENALSCVHSILMAGDATAVESVRVAGGLGPLFALAMGEEPSIRSRIHTGGFLAQANASLEKRLRTEIALRPSQGKEETPPSSGGQNVPSSRRKSAVQRDCPHLTFPDCCGSLKNASMAPVADAHIPPGPFSSGSVGCGKEVCFVANEKAEASRRRQMSSAPSVVRPAIELAWAGRDGERLRILAAACLVRCLRGRRSNRDGSDSLTAFPSSPTSTTPGATPQLKVFPLRDRGRQGGISGGSAAAASLSPVGGAGINRTKRVKPACYNRKRSSAHTPSNRITLAVSEGGVGDDKHLFVRDTSSHQRNHDATDARAGIYHPGGIANKDPRPSPTTTVFTELERIGAVQKAPELLMATCPLLQELGLLLLLRGLERTRKETFHSHTREVKQRKRLLDVTRNNTNCLHSLCWLMLHRHREVSQAAAALAKTLASRPRDEGWSIALVEQGCVPLLWMAAGGGVTSQSSVVVSTVSSSESLLASAVPMDARRQWPRGAGLNTNRLSGTQPLDDGEALSLPPERGADDTAASLTDGPCGQGLRGTEECKREENNGGLCCPSETARHLLKIVSREVSVQQHRLERLVQTVCSYSASSGNRELRVNVALGLVLLSIESAESHNKHIRRSFVSGGAIAGVLSMLRSQTGGRPAAISFLRVILALLDDPPPPVDFFGVRLEDTASLRSDVLVEEACAPIRSIVKTSGDLSKDSIFRVWDPLACRPLSSSIISGRGGKTEAEGINMACPPRDVISQASSGLRRLLAETPQGYLPLLHGRYKTWEEIMAHMAAPHMFKSTCSTYSTQFLLEMFDVAARFSIKGQVDGYARELRQRLIIQQQQQPSRAVVTEDNNTKNNNNNRITTGDHVPLLATSTTGKARSNGGSFDVAACSASIVVGTESTDLVSRQQEEGNGSSSSSSSSDRRNNEPRNYEYSNNNDGKLKSVISVLEVSLRCRHEWLCHEAFRQAVVVLEEEEGEARGLSPAHSQELTLLLDLLQQIISTVLLLTNNIDDCDTLKVDKV